MNQFGKVTQVGKKHIYSGAAIPYIGAGQARASPKFLGSLYLGTHTFWEATSNFAWWSN